MTGHNFDTEENFITQGQAEHKYMTKKHNTSQVKMTENVKKRTTLEKNIKF